MSDQPVFAATYSDMKIIKTRGVVQLVFEMPIQNYERAHSILGGLPNSGVERWVGIAPIKEPPENPKQVAKQLEKATEPKEPKSEKDAIAQARKLTLSQRAALLCKDEMFHRFVETRSDFFHERCDEEEATKYMRYFCNVQSRSEIVVGSPAAARLDLLQSAYIGWRYSPEEIR